MNEMLKKATFEELSVLLDTIWELPELSQKQTALASEIVDELTERGKLPQVTISESDRAYEQIKAIIAKGNHNKKTYGHNWVQSVIDRMLIEKCKSKRRWKTGSIVAASLLVAILLTNTLSSAAIGLNFLDDFFSWTGQAIFSLFSGAPIDDEKSVNLEMQVLHNKLDELGIEIGLPVWLPPGFSYSKMEILFDSTPYTIQSWFANIDTEEEFSLLVDGGGNELISIRTEVNDCLGIGSIVRNGRQYSIFTNNSRTAVIWEEGTYQIVMHGDLSYEDVEGIVNSIGE